MAPQDITRRFGALMVLITALCFFAPQFALAGTLGEPEFLLDVQGPSTGEADVRFGPSGQVFQPNADGIVDSITIPVRTFSGWYTDTVLRIYEWNGERGAPVNEARGRLLAVSEVRSVYGFDGYPGPTGLVYEFQRANEIPLHPNQHYYLEYQGLDLGKPPNLITSVRWQATTYPPDSDQSHFMMTIRNFASGKMAISSPRSGDFLRDANVAWGFDYREPFDDAANRIDVAVKDFLTGVSVQTFSKPLGDATARTQGDHSLPAKFQVPRSGNFVVTAQLKSCDGVSCIAGATSTPTLFSVVTEPLQHEHIVSQTYMDADRSQSGNLRFSRVGQVFLPENAGRLEQATFEVSTYGEDCSGATARLYVWNGNAESELAVGKGDMLAESDFAWVCARGPVPSDPSGFTWHFAEPNRVQLLTDHYYYIELSLEDPSASRLWVTIYGTSNGSLIDGRAFGIGGDALLILDGTLGANLSLTELTQSKSDKTTPILEGGATTENTVVFGAKLQSSLSSTNQLQLEVEYTTSTVFSVVANAASGIVAQGSVATTIALNLQDGQYRWRARAVDAMGSTVSAWQEFGTAGNTDFVVHNLGQDAAALAKLVINDPYLGDGKTFGGKGWDASSSLYVAPQTIGSGYFYWNNKVATTTFGKGLDCSGLVQWAFNRSSDPFKSLTRNAVRYDSANGQYHHNSDIVPETNLKPGDLLFFGTTSTVVTTSTHVAMYVGNFVLNNETFDMVEARSPILGIVPAHKLTRERDEGFLALSGFRRVALSPALGGSVKAGSPIDLEVTDPDGFTITATTSIQTDEELLREVPGELYYSESELGPDGRPESIVYWPAQKTGDYRIKALPQAGVSPSSTYSLTFQSGSTTVLLAENVPLSQIPDKPYAIRTTTTTAEKIIPLNVEIKPETLNLSSKGIFTTFVTIPTGFDATIFDINSSTLIISGAKPTRIETKAPRGLLVKFNTQDLVNITPGDDVKLTVSGALMNGTKIEGWDTIRVINKGKIDKEHEYDE